MKVRRMLGRRGRSISAVVVALGLLAAACGDSGGKSTSPTQTGSTGTATGSATTAAAKPTPGGELRYLLPIESPSMDPCAWTFSGQGTNALRAIPVYDSLIRLNNATGEYSYQIAESLKPSADFKTWTLKIKSGVLFSDGTTFDAAAVKYNWERLGDPALKCQMAGQVAGIDSMTVVDPLTLSVVLKDASSSFPDVVSSRIGVIGSPTAMKSLGADFGSKPVGAGPFVVESWVKDDKMVLVKNPKYYQASKGLPYLDKITIRPLLDENQRRASLEKGEADLIFTQIPTTIAPLEANKNVNVTKYSLQGAENMLFNVTTAPFKDVRARKAFIQSVDTKKLAEVVFANGLPPADGFIYPESPYDNPSVKWPSYDCKAATDAWATLAKENGGPIKIVIGVFNQGQPPSAEFMQAALTQCGGSNVQVSVDSVDAAAATARVFAKTFTVHGWGIQFVARPDSILTQLTCGNARNTTGFCSTKMDDLLKTAKITSDNATLKTLYGQIEQILADEVPVFFYKRSVVAAAATPAVQGVSIYEDGIIPVEELWLKK